MNFLRRTVKLEKFGVKIMQEEKNNTINVENKIENQLSLKLILIMMMNIKFA